MMGRIWRVCLFACFLVCGLGLVGGAPPTRLSALDHPDEVLGSVPFESIAKHSFHDGGWEEGLGSDMCPECKPLPTNIFPKSSPSSNIDVEDRPGADMSPKKRGTSAAAAETAASELPAGVEHGSLYAEERVGVDDKFIGCNSMDHLGADMCPECRQPLPMMPTSSSSPQQQSNEGDQHNEEVEMRIRGQRREGFVPTGSSLELMSMPREDDLGADMCPECRWPIPEGSNTPSSNFAERSKEEDSYGVDMCPECRIPLPVQVPMPSSSPHTAKMDVLPTEMQQQLLSEAGKDGSILLPTMDFNNVVLQLQKLAALQQAQLDQLDGLLRQFGRSHQLGTEAKLTKKSLAEEQQQALSGAEVQVPDTASVVPNTPTEQRPLLDGMSSSLASEGTTGKFEPQLRDTDSEATAATLESLESVTTQQLQQANRGSTSSTGGRGMTVARYRPAWSEHFSFLSAVKVDGEVSCLHLLPQEGEEGTSRYVVIGDTTGRLYIFLWLGDLLLDYRTVSTSPITAMLSYTIQKNETILVTGHSDGAVVVHQVWEKEEQGSISDDGRVTLVSIETLHTLVPPAARSPSPTSKLFVAGSEAGNNERSMQEGMMNEINYPEASGKGGGGDEGGEREFDDQQKILNITVTNLEMYKLGQMRYTLVGDASGKIQLFRDNGSLHGVVQSPSRPLAFMKIPSAQRFIFLTDVGVGLLDFRSMQVRRYSCEGLNGSTVTSYSFDVVGRSKAHGFTSDGDLVSVALSGDMIHFKCHVKRKRKLQITGPFVPQALKGYLITSTRDRIVVFNTTLPSGLNYASFRMAGPTPLFSATMDEIALSFLSRPGLVKQSRWPLLASNRDRLVVVGFGDGYVGVFRSILPTTRPADFTAKFWNSSVLVSALAILVVLQLLARKRDGAAVAGTGGLDHTLITPSGDLMAFDTDESARLAFEQTRKGAEPRRYRSPTRGYVDSKSAPFGSDSRRYNSSSAVDTGISYSARREPLFGRTQPVGELELRQ